MDTIGRTIGRALQRHQAGWAGRRLAATPRAARALVITSRPSSSARHSSGAAYDKSAYAHAPAEPQYSLPTDAPAEAFELFYFATRGRGEQIRLVLVETGLPYVDRLLSQWQLRKLKAAGSPLSNPDFLNSQIASPLPFGSLPMMRRRKDGLVLSQTIAILQFIAEEGGLLPTSARSKARAQMLVAGGDDLFSHYWPIQLDKNKYHYHSGAFPLTPTNHADYVQAPATHLAAPFDAYTVPKAFRRETLPRWLTYFEALLQKGDALPGAAQKSKGEYFVDDRLTYVDLVLFAHFDACRSIEPECLKPFPLLAAHYERIAAREKIKAYLEKRPPSGL